MLDIDSLQAGGGALKIAVIDGKHDRFAGLGIEDTRKTVLHPPIQGARALQKKTFRLLRNMGIKLFCLFDFIRVWHALSPFNSK